MQVKTTEGTFFDDCRSSCRDVCCRKCVLRNFAKFTEKQKNTCARDSFLIKLPEVCKCNFIKRDSGTGVFL